MNRLLNRMTTWPFLDRAWRRPLPKGQEYVNRQAPHHCDAQLLDIVGLVGCWSLKNELL